MNVRLRSYSNLCAIYAKGLFWRFFRELLIYLGLRKCQKDCEILKIILVPDFCPVKPEIARFSMGFRNNFFAM